MYFVTAQLLNRCLIGNLVQAPASSLASTHQDYTKDGADVVGNRDTDRIHGEQVFAEYDTEK